MKLQVVSFSIFGDEPFYLEGAVENTKSLRRHYPEWECRFYFSTSTVPANTLTRLAWHGARLIPMPQRERFDGLMWRFLPLHDPDVDLWLSRDADSRPSSRETMAVDEWLASGRAAHLMRDHPAHRLPIMGGMFGIDNRRLRHNGGVPDIRGCLNQWNSRCDYKGYDQDWLRDHLWPLIKDDHIAHDTYGHFHTGHERPFPSPALPGECRFVGERIRVNSPIFRSPRSVPSPSTIDWATGRRIRSPIRRPGMGWRSQLTNKDV